MGVVGVEGVVAAELLAQGLSGSQWSGLKKPLRSLHGGKRVKDWQDVRKDGISQYPRIDSLAGDQPQFPQPSAYLLSRNGDWQTPEYDSKATAPESEPRETLPVREGREAAGRAELGLRPAPAPGAPVVL